MKVIYIWHQQSGLHEYLEFLLKSQGQDVYVLSIENVAQIKTKADLVLLEVGTDLARVAGQIRELRANHGAVPVLLVHSSRNALTREQAWELGADDVFPRLGGAELLLEKIHYHLTINLLLERSFSRRKWVSESFGGIDQKRYAVNSRALLRQHNYYKTALQHDSHLT